MIKRLLVPFLFLPSLLFAESSTTTFSLENGLKLIVKEDHRAPIMTTQVWYKVGSSYEHEGITGVSHVLEHGKTGSIGTMPSFNNGRLTDVQKKAVAAYIQSLKE